MTLQSQPKHLIGIAAKFGGWVRIPEPSQSTQNVISKTKSQDTQRHNNKAVGKTPAQNQMSNLVEKNQINSYKFVQRTKENNVYITERKWGKLCLTK